MEETNLQDLADKAQWRVEGGDEDTSGLSWFLVGGAVRDALRGMQPTDFDFVVVGESRASMQERGFRLVNSENNDTFPVFLNSDREEFALARAEHSTGDGHTDFDVEVGVSLRKDLERRDLTINSMALSKSGELIDPFDGRVDLRNGLIRHTSDAFAEDPLRVLRAARFSARLGARPVRETQDLMEELGPRLSELPQERVRMEMFKNFTQSPSPRWFFDVLDQTNVLGEAFPILDELQGVPAGPSEHHREGSAFEHTMRVLEEMKDIRPNDKLAMLMALTHDFGKVKTPSSKLPTHHGHGKDGVPVVREFGARLAVSNEQMRAMKDATRQHMRLKQIDEMRSATLFDLVQETRFVDRLIDLLVADGRGKEPQVEFPASLARERVDAARKAMQEVTGQTLIDRGRDPQQMGGEKFGRHLRDARIARMKQIEASSGGGLRSAK